MGQCVKCGKETVRAYPYYWGSSMPASDGLLIGNLRQDSGFLCEKCYKKNDEDQAVAIIIRHLRRKKENKGWVFLSPNQYNSLK